MVLTTAYIRTVRMLLDAPEVYDDIIKIYQNHRVPQPGISALLLVVPLKRSNTVWGFPRRRRQGAPPIAIR